MQTPKEKAYRLVKDFYVITTTSKQAKQCAKLHINLILERLDFRTTYKYYQEVLKEIEKL